MEINDVFILWHTSILCINPYSCYMLYLLLFIVLCYSFFCFKIHFLFKLQYIYSIITIIILIDIKMKMRIKMKKIFYMYYYCRRIQERASAPKFPTGKEKRDEHREERNVSDVKILYLIHTFIYQNLACICNITMYMSGYYSCCILKTRLYWSLTRETHVLQQLKSCKQRGKSSDSVTDKNKNELKSRKIYQPCFFTSNKDDYV